MRLYPIQHMKSADNKAAILFLYFIQLLPLKRVEIHIVIRKITLTIHIVRSMICITMKNNVL